MEKIGPVLYVHAGLHPAVLEYDLDIDSINETARENWGVYKGDPSSVDRPISFILDDWGPLRYRGYFRAKDNSEKISEEDLDHVLKYYNADKIAVGHTIVDRVSNDYHGKVIRLDTPRDQTEGLLIKRGEFFRIDETEKISQLPEASQSAES